MKLRYRYKRLSLWNKLGAWGAISSIVGILLSVFFYYLDSRPNVSDMYIVSTANNKSPVLIIPQNAGWPAGTTIHKGEKAVGLGYWGIDFSINKKGFHYKTQKAQNPSFIPWKAIDEWTITRQGISFYYYRNVIDQKEEKKSSRYHFILKLPYGKIQFDTLDNFRKFATTKENKNLSNLKQDNFSGEILFKDGRKVKYNWLRTSGHGMEAIPYSKELSYNKEPDSLNKLDLTKITRIDFDNEWCGFDLTNKKVPEYARVNNWIYKADVTFRDATVCDLQA